VGTPEDLRWSEGVADIPLRDDLDLVTHSTAERAERFHRTYIAGEDRTLAEMVVRADDNQRQEVSSLFTAADPLVAATAVREMLVSNVFAQSARFTPFTAATRIGMAGEIAKRNLGIQRAFYDFAVPREDAFVIPMPGVITPQFEQGDAELDKLKEAMPVNFSGVFRYMMPGTTNTSVEEFYREGTFVGKVTTVTPDEYLYEPTVEATDAGGAAMEFGDTSYRGLTREIRFLKTLAENDEDMAGLILAG
jgi:hypothetical protein